eukprot:5986585-Alexandrium_andersonii.AAC.1
MAKMWQSIATQLRKKLNALEVNDGSQTASVAGRAKVVTGPVAPTKTPQAVGAGVANASPPSAKGTESAPGAETAEPSTASQSAAGAAVEPRDTLSLIHISEPTRLALI